MKAQVEKKELEVFKKEITTSSKTIVNLEIVDESSYKEAVTIGRTVQATLKKITARKEEITKPLNQAIKSTRELFAPLETTAKEIIESIKTKMIDYQREETKKAEEQKAKILDRVERGTMTAETAVRKLNEDIVAPEKTVTSDAGSATVIKRKAYRVVDKKLVPLDFMEVDMVKVKEAFKAGQPVHGIEEYEEQNIRLV